MNTKKLKKSFEKCNSCGGNLKYSPQDFSLKCTKCGRAVFMSVDEVKKITKSLISKNEETNG